MMVSANEGWTKPKIEEGKYSFENDKVWQYIQSTQITDEEEMRKLNEAFVQYNRPLNIDELCHVSSTHEEFDKASSIFRYKEYQEYFFEYFEKKCAFRNKC